LRHAVTYARALLGISATGVDKRDRGGFADQVGKATGAPSWFMAFNWTGNRFDRSCGWIQGETRSDPTNGSLDESGRTLASQQEGFSEPETAETPGAAPDRPQTTNGTTAHASMPPRQCSRRACFIILTPFMVG